MHARTITSAKPARALRSIVATALLAAAGLVLAPSPPAAAYTPTFTFAGVRDWDRDGRPDVVARDVSGNLWLYPGRGNRSFGMDVRAKIWFGWNGFTFAGVADWDRDGKQDVVARDASGNLWLYPGRGNRDFGMDVRAKIWFGWTGFVFAGVTDWDVDGKQDVLARDGNGDLWLYPGRGNRGFGMDARAKVWFGW